MIFFLQYLCNLWVLKIGDEMHIEVPQKGKPAQLSSAGEINFFGTSLGAHGLGDDISRVGTGVYDVFGLLVAYRPINK